MGRLACHCLNVSVYFTDTSWNSRPVPARQLLPDGSSDKLASETLYELELDVAGVTTEYKVLVVSRTLVDWVIRTCTNCNMDVYVTHAVKDSGRTFVTHNLLCDAVAIETIQKSKEYSPVFRLVLKGVSEEEERSYQRRRLSSNTFGREDPVMKVVHSQMKSFLNHEEVAMEARIRQFELAQREAYSQLQKRAQDDRTLLFAIIARARESGISDAIKDETITRTSPTVTPSHSTPSRVPPRNRSPPIPEQQKLTITIKDPRPQGNTLVPTSHVPNPSDDVLFSLEGFDEEEVEGGVMSEGVDAGTVAFPQSDDEEISTDDSSFRDVSTLGGIAMSVPVGIPMFATVPQKSKGPQQIAGSLSDQFNPDDVGHNIRALALSVHDTGMFGDLPKPRIKDT